ncbi:Defective in cullin neddylation protein [Arachis hypogaea]|nr:Defective in cullin neddylation protein [Arachis hypogaea]
MGKCIECIKLQTYDYYSNYPVTLPLRMPYSGNPDFSEFIRFYDFVFFMCHENGQKNISVSRAVTAWKLILAGNEHGNEH